MDPTEVSFVIITGLSGSGKTESMKALEDSGFYCIHNLPPALLPKVVELKGGFSNRQQYAMAMDIRGKEYFDQLEQAFDWLRQSGYTHKIVFLESSDAVLVRRFSEVRRVHPLAGQGSIYDSIAMERNVLAPIKERAHIVLDTSTLKAADLRAKVYEAVTGRPVTDLMQVDVFSFGFKYGVPMDADMIFDVRFVPNPYYVPELRPMTGLDKPCANYVLEHHITQSFVERVARLVLDLTPHYSAEGKSRLSVGIGCTGGQHRSVAITEALADQIRSAGGNVKARHRELSAGHVGSYVVHLDERRAVQ